MSDITVHRGLFGHVDLHVEDTGGSGRPVVLIHGWPLSGESWKNQVPALRDAGYRVITYDRRGFGRSDKPKTGYDYDHFAEDLHKILDALDLSDVTLVGFSMGGGEVARYLAKYGDQRIHSVVFAAAVTPFMAQSLDNPDGPLSQEQADAMTEQLKNDEDAFYPEFTRQFFSVGDELKVTEQDVQDALTLEHQADHDAALAAMAAFGTTDFRNDLVADNVPTLVIHGAGDGVVPFEGSGKLTHDQVPQSELVLIDDAPHGLNVSHKDEFNAALLAFLAK